MSVNLEFPAGRGAQGFTCFVSICCFLYYLFKRPNVGWENLWVQSMEVVFYAMSIAFNMQPLELANGNTIVWVRYVSWMMTCPVLLCQISGLPEHGAFEGQSVKKTVVLMLANQAMILGGVSAVFFTEIYFKLPLLAVSFISFGVCLYIVGGTCLSALASYPGRAKKQLLVVAASFVIGWTVFPVLYCIGPEGLDIISQEASLIAHCMGDLLSKNFFGFVSYQLNWNVLPKTIGELATAEPDDDVDVEKAAIAKQREMTARFEHAQSRSSPPTLEVIGKHSDRPYRNEVEMATPSTLRVDDSSRTSGNNSGTNSGRNTPPTASQLARRGSFAQPVKVRTPKSGSGNNTPRAVTPPRASTGNSGGGTPTNISPSPRGRKQLPAGAVEDWSEQDVYEMLCGFGFHSAADKALDSAVDGEMLVSLSAEDLRDELELGSLQVKRVLQAVGKSVTPPRSRPVTPQRHHEVGFEDEMEPHNGPVVL